MIANPRDVPVDVLTGADVEEKTVSIQINEAGLLPFVLLSDGSPVAQSSSARALSRWALDQGARFVRFDFDLREER